MDLARRAAHRTTFRESISLRRGGKAYFRGIMSRSELRLGPCRTEITPTKTLRLNSPVMGWFPAGGDGSPGAGVEPGDLRTCTVWNAAFAPRAAGNGTRAATIHHMFACSLNESCACRLTSWKSGGGPLAAATSQRAIHRETLCHAP